MLLFQNGNIDILSWSDPVTNVTIFYKLKNNAAILQLLNDNLHTFIQGLLTCLQVDIRVQRRLIGRRDTCIIFNLSLSRLFIETLDIPLFTDLQGAIAKDLYQIFLAKNLFNPLPVSMKG